MLDVTNGRFTGLRATSRRDPEQLQHGPHQCPTNPPPGFAGGQWASITIDKSWHEAVTKTPAPIGPLAPVLHRFSVTKAPSAWRVSAAGVHTVPAGQTSLLVNVWGCIYHPRTLT